MKDLQTYVHNNNNNACLKTVLYIHRVKKEKNIKKDERKNKFPFIGMG